jgi:DNA-binding MarR family transcriptional regulator
MPKAKPAPESAAESWQQPRTFLYLLKRAHLAARAAADDALAPLGISVAQYAIMRRLEDDPGLSGAELARRCSVTAPTINGLLTALELAGLIERLPDPEGGRCILARLTEAGEQRVGTGHAVIDRLEERLLTGIDAKTRDQLLAVLSTVIDNADAIGVFA